jgi:hypothetical protein
MTDRTRENSVVILYRGGRLPTWDQLDGVQQLEYQQQHVNLMLSVAEQYGLISIHGYRLLAPRGNWERFWAIEFPDLAGAEAWMAAEVAPPYGRYGFYEYDLARRWHPESLSWMPRRVEPAHETNSNPHIVPPLAADPSSIAVLAFSRWTRGSDEVDPAVRGDDDRRQRLREVAGDHDLIHGEAFRLVGSGRDGDLVWVLEFPHLSGAEAWIDAEMAPPAGAYQERVFHLARRWAPYYFSTWPPRR